jgi:hypothetical protein
MSEELDLLLASAGLAELLAHYGRLAEIDRDVWHPRLNELAGSGSRELSQMHGELIAYGWIDLAVYRYGGETGSQRTGGYRITPDGRRALREAKVDLAPSSVDSTNITPEGPAEGRRSRKKAGPAKSLEAASGNERVEVEMPPAA